MNGPQHYARAEEILSYAKGHPLPADAARAYAAVAHVHAILAQVALDAQNTLPASETTKITAAWQAALGAPQRAQNATYDPKTSPGRR